MRTYRGFEKYVCLQVLTCEESTFAIILRPYKQPTSICL